MVISGVWLVTVIYSKDDPSEHPCIYAMKAFSCQENARLFANYQRDVFRASQKLNKKFEWTKFDYKIEETTIDSFY